MKKTIQTALKRSVFLSALLLIAIVGRAQICPGFYIKNGNQQCKITIAYKIFKGPTCATTCSGAGIVIAPGSAYFIPGGCIFGSEDIELIITMPGGATVGPLNYGSGTGGGGPWPCYGPAVQSATGADPCFGTYNVMVTCGNALVL